MRTLVALVMLLTASSAEATYVDGNKLQQWCASAPDSTAAGLATGYILGVYDRSDDGSPRAYCVPNSVKIQQLRDVACLWLEKHPAWRPYSAHSLVGSALKEAWPCPK